jgi:pyruvate dehydrogenase E2 component (dihydrolipoamide acetyltransferase)
VNIGIVTALEDGLLIPVLKGVDQLSLADVVEQANGLVARAKASRPKADDLVGGTFSISNVGPFDVEQFAAIISPGQGAILAVSSFVEEALVVDGQVRPGNVMRATLSADHRVIDGVVAAQFLKELKRLLEEPILLVA